jgi:hypothetical protein
LYRSHNIVREIKCRILGWVGHAARMKRGKSAFQIITHKPTGKRPVGRSRHRLEERGRMALK